MNNLLRRWLSVTLLTCLMFSHTIPALAAEPKNIVQTKSEYVESTTEEIEIRETDQIDETVDELLLELPPEWECPEPCPEEPDQPEADEPSDLLKAPQAEERENPEDEEQLLVETEPTDIELIDTELADVVYDEEELEAWIELHKETGGTVYLGANVTITDSMPIYDIYGEITVDTGKYGLVFDGATLPSQVILITGEGVDTPVVDVWSTNGGDFWSSSWNNHLMVLNVTATGRDGIGGTALRILAKDSKTFDPFILHEAQGIIQSYGVGAVGLWLDVSMEAWCYRIEVFGENSVAVYAPKGADLYYCKLTANGKGACSVEGNNVLLDCCAASPESDNALNFHRSLLPDSLNHLYLPVQQNEPLTPWDIYPFENLLLPLSGGDGYDPAYRSFLIEWDYDAWSSIDTSVIGKNVISGCFLLPFQGLGLDDSLLQLTVEVRDPALPCIGSITADNDEEGKYFYLDFWDYYDLEEGNVVLWRSDDEGATWWDATWSEDIIWEGYGLYFSYDELEDPVWFVLELVGVGDSNTVVLSEKNGQPIGGNGGDRTGTDRDGGGSSGDGGDSTSGSRSKPGDVGTSKEDGEKSDGNGADEIGGTDETGSEASADSTSQGSGSQENSSSNADGSQDSVNLNSGLTADIAETIQSNIQVADLPAQNTSTLGATPADSAQNYLLSEDININADSEDHEPSSDQSASPPLPFDPEQSAPNPGFSTHAVIILFLVIASLFACALLIMRFLHGGRRHGKS